MTRVLLGSYRGKSHVETALASIDQHLKGVTSLVIINDSPDPDIGPWLSQYGKVVNVGGRGYGRAMRELCAAAEGQEAFVYEEDFRLLEDIHLDQLSEILWYRPWLAQISLLRGPHFPIEHQHGGLIEALVARGHQFDEVHGIIEHRACFTMNPTLIRGAVLADGWPLGKWSEEIKGDNLVKQGYRFGYLPGIRCAHDGERSGHGY